MKSVSLLSAVLLGFAAPAIAGNAGNANIIAPNNFGTTGIIAPNNFTQPQASSTVSGAVRQDTADTSAKKPPLFWIKRFPTFQQR